MATISNTPRPGYAWDATDNCWYPIGTGPHTHADYITSGSAINPTIVDAKGDIIAATAADTVARLAVGANDTVLTADSSTATGLKWAAPSAGGMTLISETVASGLSSLSLSSIPNTYKHLLLTWHGIVPSVSGTSGFFIRYNNNSTADIYQGKMLGGSTSMSNTTMSSNNSTNAINIGSGSFGWYDSNASTNLTKNPAGSLIIYNYASTTKYKYYETQFYHNNINSTQFGFQIMATFMDTTAISSIDVIRDAGTATFSNATGTSIRLYGLS